MLKLLQFFNIAPVTVGQIGASALDGGGSTKQSVASKQHQYFASSSLKAPVQIQAQYNAQQKTLVYKCSNEHGATLEIEMPTGAD